MPRLRLSRRSFLRGTTGVALALPALEAMLPRDAHAAETPGRFLVAFGGLSLGRKRLDSDASTTDLFAPDNVGPGYDLKLALQPLGTAGVRDDVSVVSNLTLPWGAAGAVPAGGRIPAFHNFCFGPQLCGVRGSTALTAGPVLGPTSDQLVAEAIGAASRVRVMTYRVQADTYTASGNPGQSRMSYARGTNGVPTPVTPKVSPHLIFQELFTGLAPSTPPPPGGPAPVDAATRALERRISVLDVVHRRAARLAQRLGTADRLKLQQHLDLVRSLEVRLQALVPPPQPPGTDGGTPVTPPLVCGAPADPADPSSTITGYSDEELRAELIVDMIALAFACDLSRSASLMFTMAQSAMNVQALVGTNRSLHDMSHVADDVGRPGSGLEGMARVQAWHVKHFARLVSRLKELTDSDGSPVLNHTAAVLVFEGGHGFDPQTNEPNRVHSTEHMSALIAGRAGGLLAGRHVRTNGAHPSSVIVSAMRAVGVTAGLGEVTAHVPELFP